MLSHQTDMYLVSKQQTDCFQTLLPTVNIISQEEVVGLWWESSILKQPKKVRVLSVDVACKQRLISSMMLCAAQGKSRAKSKLMFTANLDRSFQF